MWKQVFGLLSPAGERARLSILILHRVTAEPDAIFPGEMHAARFNALCAWVSRRFNVLPLDDALSRLRGGTLPSRAMCITFDDGYADNLTVALPILRRHGLTATVFVSTGFLDGGRMWNDTIIEAVRAARGPALNTASLCQEGPAELPIELLAERRHAVYTLLGRAKYLSLEARRQFADELQAVVGADLPTNLMLTSAQVRSLHEHGIGIGAHTVSHPILATLSDAEAMAEIADSKRQLESLTQASVHSFAYPNGQPGHDYLPRHPELVKESGFRAAFTTLWGTSHPGSDFFQLPRFTPWNHPGWRFGLRLAKNLWG